MNIQKQIWSKFHIHGHDNLPFVPWLEDASRNHLAELFHEVGFTRGAEIGVRMGQYSRIMLKVNPNLTLLCIDPWSAYGRVSQEKQNSFLRACRRNLASYKAEIIVKSSMDALSDVPDGSLDFVYIDGMHEFDFVMQDIICWSKKVKSGGIVSGHDYYPFYRGGVVGAVDAYTKAHNIQLWYITRERTPSFFWIKD